MSDDLTALRKMLKRAGARFSEWNLSEEYRPATRVMSIGCPDGNGYSQALFNAQGKLLEFKVLNNEGKECDCTFCGGSKPDCDCDGDGDGDNGCCDRGSCGDCDCSPNERGTK